MLSSISPLGEGARASRWLVTVTAYVVASTAGGAIAGGAAAALGSRVPGSWRSSPAGGAFVAALLLLGLALDLGLLGARLPSWHRQVDELWLSSYRGWVYGAGFGVQLGLGVVTIVTSSTVYAVWLLASLSGNLMAGLLIGSTFGLARALPVTATAGVRSVHDLHRIFWSLDRWSRPAKTAAQWALAAAGIAVATLSSVR